MCKSKSWMEKTLSFFRSEPWIFSREFEKPLCRQCSSMTPDNDLFLPSFSVSWNNWAVWQVCCYTNVLKIKCHKWDISIVSLFRLEPAIVTTTKTRKLEILKGKVIEIEWIPRIWMNMRYMRYVSEKEGTAIW